MQNSRWINWLQQIQAISQTGIAYCKDGYDIERYKKLQEISAEITSCYSNISIEEVIKITDYDIGYATPKIAVRGAVFKDNKILMVKENADNLWTLPGGWADIGESASEAVTKEVYEESGLNIKPIKLISLFDKNKHPHPSHRFYTYVAFFLCEIIGGELKVGFETSDADFFMFEQLPKLSPGRITSAQIAMCFKHYYDRKLHTEFD